MRTTNNHQEHGMSLVVQTVSRITVGLILLYGIHIVLHGHLAPGGGFAGGVIIALSFIQLVLAFGKDEALRKIPKPFISVLESIGATLFLGIAILGFLGGYFFLDWMNKGKPFDLFSGGTMIISNIGIGLKVSLGLFGIFLVLILLKFTPKK
ncbi:MAG: MnhB domain-containing protein [Candidatus Omnitrophica bacterium]|nr:MnhB domain-containing protein [Candidatus Omnitrophota bacterium]